MQVDLIQTRLGTSFVRTENPARKSDPRSWVTFLQKNLARKSDPRLWVTFLEKKCLVPRRGSLAVGHLWVTFFRCIVGHLWEFKHPSPINKESTSGNLWPNRPPDSNRMEMGSVNLQIAIGV